MYKLIESPFDGEIRTVNKQDGNVVLCIPFNPANTDYANFKREINEGTAQLEDADGNLMTAEQAKDFVKELP